MEQANYEVLAGQESTPLDLRSLSTESQYIIRSESRCEATEFSGCPASRKARAEVPISEKCLLTLEEAAAYTGIGICKLREMSNDERCDFVLWNGTKRMLKKEKLRACLEAAYSI